MIKHQETATKQCSKCRLFLERRNFNKRKASKDGLNIYCKICHYENVVEWRKNNPEKIRAQRDKYKNTGQRKYRSLHYGISPEQYDEMFEAQNGACAICGATDRKLVIDHCHETGLVRGILCHNCNAGIGMLQDDPSVISSALWYLELTKHDKTSRNPS